MKIFSQFLSLLTILMTLTIASQAQARIDSPVGSKASGGGDYQSTMLPSKTAEQNRVALLSDIKAAILAKKDLNIPGGAYSVGEIEINGLTNNSTTAALGEGDKLHLRLAANTVIMTQLGNKFIDLDLSDNTITVIPSALTTVYGTGVSTTTVADPPFFAGRYMRITVPDAMVNSAADVTTVFNKYDMVTLEDQTPLYKDDVGVNEGFQAEDFEILETVEVSGAADDYIYVSSPLKPFNIANARLHLWKNKDTEFSVTGGRFKADPATGDFESKSLTRSTTTSIVFDILGVKAPILKDIKVSDTFTGFAQIQHSMLFKADNVQGERARNQSTPTSPDYRSLSYMFDIYGANKNYSITNSGGNGWRHVHTTNTSQATSYSAGSWMFYGEAIKGQVDGYRGAFNQGASLDTHNPGYGVMFKNANIQSGVEYPDGLIAPRCFSNRSSNTSIQDSECYGSLSFMTEDGWEIEHYGTENVTTIENSKFLKPMHVPTSAGSEDEPAIETTGKAGINEDRIMRINNFQLEDFGTFLEMAANGGHVVIDNLQFKGDIYRISSGGRNGFNITDENKLTIKNTTLDFRNADVIDNTLSVNNALIKRFGSLTGDVELTLENVTILGCSKFDVAADHRLFANDGSGIKTIRYKNFYCDDADVLISGGTGVTLVNLNAAAVPLPNVQVFTADGTWTAPAGATSCSVSTMGGGGGGGGAGRFLSGALAGGAGGGSGAYTEFTFAMSDLGATEAVVVGAGGTGGAGSSSATSGATGGNGGDSTFGTAPKQVRAQGGKGGSGSGTAGAGGAFGTQLGNAGGAGVSGAAGSTGTPTSSVFGLGITAGSGGAGGGIDAAGTTAFAGGAGGRMPASYGTGGSGSAGAATGAAGGNSTGPTVTSTAMGGGGGGGGGGNSGGNGGTGGNGSTNGGGGAGGGVGAATFTGGSGGNGARGIVIVTCH